MNYFFISDTHFGHGNILKYSNRSFDTIEEMDEKLIENWNEIVSKNDTICHLGDFCMRTDYRKYANRLNGNIVYIRGSHDQENWPYMNEFYPNGLKDEFGTKRLIVLCHYALRSWPKSHYASWHLFGHHHGKLDPYGLSFDVGVDCNNYYPFSLDEIIVKMKTLSPIVDFRRKE